MENKEKLNQPIGKTTKPDSPIVKIESTISNNNTCSYGGQEYSQGTEICMSKAKMRCGPSGWFDTGFSC